VRVRIYTIGHGTRQVAELIELLESVPVGRLIDVRRFPGSRRHPQFNKESLGRSLQQAGIVYEWRGDDFGGRRSATTARSRHGALRNASLRAYADYMDTEQFHTALQRLEVDAEQGPSLAIMCAETLWWRCHRRHIADALSLHGLEVIHLARGALTTRAQSSSGDETGR
jgi:uncharacterized protein (DUF488 family)